MSFDWALLRECEMGFQNLCATFLIQIDEDPGHVVVIRGGYVCVCACVCVCVCVSVSVCVCVCVSHHTVERSVCVCLSHPIVFREGEISPFLPWHGKGMVPFK